MLTSLLKIAQRGAFVCGVVAITGFGFALNHSTPRVAATKAPAPLPSMVHLASLTTGQNGVRPVTVSRPESPTLSDKLQRARLIPVEGAPVGSYAEVSRLVSREDWNALAPGQRQLIGSMVRSAQAGHAMPEACFGPGTSPSVISAFAHLENSLHAAGYAANSLAAAPLRVRNRWTSTATDGNISVGQPFTLTWNLVPDGTAEGNGTTGTSDLIAFATKKYGSAEPIRAAFRQVFARYQDLTGITFTEVSYDDGAAMVDTDGVLGVRADLRIGGHAVDGPSNTLAYCYYPGSGDMILDTSDDFFDGGFGQVSQYNTLAHEYGHGLGVSHSCPNDRTKLMEPYTDGNDPFRGPQLDDIQAVQYNYGDGNEKGTRNNTIDSATPLGTLSIGEKDVDEQSINATSVDVDYFQFAPDSANRTFQIKVVPRGMPYLEGPQNADGSCPAGTEYDPRNQRNLNLQLLTTTGTVLAQANTLPAGGTETISEFDAPDTGPFMVRVAAADDDTIVAVQGYTLEISLKAKPPRAPIIDPLYFTPAKPATDSKLHLFFSVSDPDGDTVTTKVAWTKNGKAITVGGSNTIDLSKPNAGDVGDVFKATVTATDPTGHSTTRSISTTIKDNTAPSFSQTTFEVNENQTLKAKVGADADRDKLTYALLSKPQHGEFTFVNGAFSFVPETNFNGSVSFRVRATDTAEVSTEATITIIVVPVNAPPVATDDTIKTKEDVQLSIPAATLLKNDVNGERSDETDPLTISAVNVSSSFPGTLKLDKTKQTILFTPRANWYGETSFTYTVQDSGDSTDKAKVVLQVAAVNDAPTTSDVTMMAIESTPVQVEISGEDIEGDMLSFLIKEKPKNGTARIIQSGDKWFLSYESKSGFSGIDTLTFVARDGFLNSEPATATIKVKANSAPVVVSLSPNKGTFAAGSTVIFEEKVHDNNGTGHLDAISLLFSNSKTVASAGKAAALWFDAQNNVFTVTADDGRSSFTPVALGKTIENSQVKVKLSKEDVVRNSNGTLILKWHVTFKTDFVGVKSLWSRAEDLAGATVGFDQNGQITIGSSSTPSGGSS